jgi:hypothetical protein
LAPAEVDWPADRAPFQEALATVTTLPDWDQVPLQPDDSAWLPA